MSARAPIAILFDLDGTLVDTVPFILASVRHAFEGYGLCPTDAQWIAGIGTPLRAQIASFARLPEDVDPLVGRYRGFWLENHDRMTRAFPGALQVVEALAASGHPLGVVTAKTEEGALRTLRHTGLLRYMQAIVGADTCARSKPDPEPVHVALARLERAPSEAVLVGDSPHDIAAARAAGVRALGVLHGACDRDRLLAAGAEALLEDLTPLPALVSAAR
ncbi:HAD family hydrolase [Anaeromyxobacter terrae]|uniref:HAD family hydrolase n=1 Tax=Anaeromyxobacter terrae TaxID=2925406 RepID=UPI001F588DF0|nr:HAD-IA family hydrolase [Anaeromyxobacter sp. SG22]